MVCCSLACVLPWLSLKMWQEVTPAKGKVFFSGQSKENMEGFIKGLNLCVATLEIPCIRTYSASPLHLLYFLQIEMMLLAQTHDTNPVSYCIIY